MLTSNFDILEKIRNDTDLQDKIYYLCDFQIYDNFQTVGDLDGYIKYSMNGKSFAEMGDGSEYVLLEDNSIGILGSESQIGRIAESLEELFSLLINCPCFYDFLFKELYLKENINLLRKLLNITEESYRKDFSQDNLDYDALKLEISKKLNIPIDLDSATNTMQKFYHSIMREPKYYYTTIDNHISDEILTSCIDDWNMSLEQIIELRLKHL